MDRAYPWGRHGFDVVGSLGWLRVEVPEASLNPGNTISADKHDLRPRCLAETRQWAFAPGACTGNQASQKQDHPPEARPRR